MLAEKCLFTVEVKEKGEREKEAIDICRALRNVAAHYASFSPDTLEQRKETETGVCRYDRAEDPHRAVARDAENVALLVWRYTISEICDCLRAIVFKYMCFTHTTHCTAMQWFFYSIKYVFNFHYNVFTFIFFSFFNFFRQLCHLFFDNFLFFCDYFWFVVLIKNILIYVLNYS